MYQGDSPIHTGGDGDQFDQVTVLVVAVSDERRREPETERALLSDAQDTETERKIVEEKKLEN